MLGLSGTSSYAVFVYLCICICVFVHETLGNISFDILGPIAFRKMYGLYDLKHHIVEKSGGVTMRDGRTDKQRTREDRATQPLDAGWLSFAIRACARSLSKKSQSVSKVCQICAKSVLTVSQKCAKYVPKVCQKWAKCPKSVTKVSQSYSKYAKSVCQKCANSVQKSVPKVCQKCPKSVQKVSQKCGT